MSKPILFHNILSSTFFLITTKVNGASYSVGGGDGVGVGVGVGGSGGDGWIGGGVSYPNPSVTSPSSLANAYVALQAWKSAIKNPSNEMGVLSGPVVAGIDLNHGNLKGVFSK
ncbi:hypothetical protein Tco_1081905 [Tanacetum coccineum]|uniref:Uncharacterized protein n=1 Tax=Tanacetum coccineum TaxID=301880 RepID=A0ABQ5I0D2_9ASTR